MVASSNRSPTPAKLKITNDSTLPPNQTSKVMKSDIIRVTIPDVVVPALPQQQDPTTKLVVENTDRIETIQHAINETESVSPASEAAPKSTDSRHTKIDGLIDSILSKFPLSDPVTLLFVGSTTDAETDTVTADVAKRLTERRVGKVLLVDANPNSRKLSSNLGLENSEGIGNVICADQSWKSVVQSGHVTGLDFLPYGNVNTAKTLRSKTQSFLADVKSDYQFICVSAGLNNSPIAKSFCLAADGIYLLVDLVQLTHVDAKAAADQFILNNLPLVGCIALDAEQEQK